MRERELHDRTGTCATRWTRVQFPASPPHFALFHFGEKELRVASHLLPLRSVPRVAPQSVVGLVAPQSASLRVVNHEARRRVVYQGRVARRRSGLASERESTTPTAKWGCLMYDNPLCITCTSFDSKMVSSMLAIQPILTTDSGDTCEVKLVEQRRESPLIQ